MSFVRRNPPRVAPDLTARFATLGVAAVHEAQGRRGCRASHMRPIYPGARAGGTAVTVSVPPADNWMIHVAVERCREGDIRIFAPTSPSDAGHFGELLATSLRARGVVGLVIEAGCRDIAELKAMDFPVWSRAVSAQGAVKETLGDVNLPLPMAGQVVHPGDPIVADDDGLVIVRREEAGAVATASELREANEAATRQGLAAGELGIDVYGMRDALATKGLRYEDV
jgi:4-hydroxy-4-methyl-2-oxoglutarate aldolase